MHTPGPWTADPKTLEAAAPKMLDALLSIASVAPRNHNGKLSYKDAYESMVRVALGAISAATGGQ